MKRRIANILGPRVPRDELRHHAVRYILPTVLLIAAGALLVASYSQPYWKMTLHAPQYPKGLHVQAYLNRLQGDVHEIDGLNHYIGMRPLNDAAQMERQTSAMLVVVVTGLLVAAIFVHSRWAAVAALPALAFPVGFLADLQYWLATFGSNLDPHAALSNSIKPFVPPVLGVGTIGQFRTVAVAGTGFWLACAAGLVVLVALFYHRRAYKPLFDARRLAARATSALAPVAVVLAAATFCQAARGDQPQKLLDLNALIAAAPPGSTLVVPPGRYAGPVQIDKPLTLTGRGAAIIDAGEQSDAVHIRAADVTLNGFQICATGDSLDAQNAGILVTAPRAIIENNELSDVLLGIVLNGAPGSVVRDNHVRGKPLGLARRGDGIRLWRSDAAIVERNRVEGVRDVVIWYSQGVRLVGNVVRDSRYGMHFMYAGGGVLQDNQLVENSVGAFLMYSRDVTLHGNVLERNRGPSGYGIGLKDMDGVRAEANRIVGNRVGLYIDNSPSRNDETQLFSRNVFAFNDVALAFLPAVQRNRFVENEFHENLEQVSILGSGELRNNEFSAGGRGNYWSDYAGFDADGDGVGDAPYRAMSLFENLIDREPKLRLFLYSPAQQAIELASRAFPVMQPQAKITDNAPLMRPAPAAERANAAASLPATTLGAAALGIPALLLRIRRAAARPTRLPQVTSAAAIRSIDSSTAAVACVAAGPPVLAIQGLTKSFGRYTAVDGLSLEIAPGEAVALWGTNGAGKTTIIKCILGLHGFRGSSRIGGVDSRRQGRAARRMIGYVSQELSFYDDLSTIQTVRFFAALKRVPANRAASVLQKVDLLDHAGKRVCELSGGMKQRLALAVALLADPPLLLLDEPTSNLDAAGRRAFFELLRRLKAAGKTILFTTHRADEVTGLADRVIVLERGRVVREGAAAILVADQWLNVTLAPATVDSAFRLLAAAGFAVTRMDGGLRIRVSPGRNVLPIVWLAQSGVAVQSVEIESETHS